jgi:hypothetical protein
MAWVVRSCDLYLTDFTDQPWWGLRDEAKRFASREEARKAARSVRFYEFTWDCVEVVRLVRKKRRAA